MMGTFTHLRLHDWAARWAEFIKDSLDLSADLKLDWEVVHCANFMGQGVAAITGFDPYEQYAERGTSALAACQLLRDEGYETLDDWVADLFPEIPLSMTHPGDVLLVKSSYWNEDEALKMMPHSIALADPPLFYGPTIQGLGKGDMFRDAIRAFAVGREV